jgi:electron transport complex protein RnfG
MSGLRDNPLLQPLVLAGFALVAAALLSSGDMLTSHEITLRNQEDLARSLAMVIPASLHDNDPLADTLMLKDEAGGERRVYQARQGGAVTAVAFDMTEHGYGTINLVIGIDRQGRVLGVRVVKHTETPGLGDKIEVEKSDWIKGFDGRSLDNTTAKEWAVRKDGGIFDQFSGATITPRAVVKAVVKGLSFFAAHQAELLAPAASGEHHQQGAGS